MFGLSGAGWGQALYFLRQYGVFLAGGAVASLPVKDALRAALQRRKAERAIQWGSALAGLGLLGLSFLQLISSTANPFIYYRF